MDLIETQGPGVCYLKKTNCSWLILTGLLIPDENSRPLPKL